MSIEFSKATIAIWWVGNNRQDVLAHLAQLEGELPELTIRMRTHVDNKIWDSADKKEWHSVTPNPELCDPDTVVQDMLDKAQSVMDELAEQFGAKVERVLMGNGGLDEFIESFTSLPGVHMKTMSEEEYEKTHGDQGTDPPH